MSTFTEPPALRRRRRVLAGAVLAVGALVVAACGGDDGADQAGGATSTEAPQATTTTAAATTTTAAQEPEEPVTLRLGYFPNITHAPALVALGEGIFTETLGTNVTLEATPFNAGPKVVEALFADAIDASYIGPNPAINAFAKSNGEAIRIVSGVTSGGAFLVVRPEITGPADLAGKKIASPQLGNTQDVALRAWLAEQGFETTVTGGGDVSVVPQENAQILEAFVAGAIDGAWVPEPWATRLITEAGATVLVDERDLWPGGQYVTTHLIVATDFLEDHPGVVKRLIEANLQAIDFVNDNPTEAQRIANAQIEAVTSKPLKPQILATAWPNLTFTADPVATSLVTSADNATKLGLLDPVSNLRSIYDLRLLDEVLAGLGRPAVPGLPG